MSIDYNAKAQVSSLKELLDDLDFPVKTPIDIVARIRTRDYCAERLADFEDQTYEDIANIALTFCDGFMIGIKDMMVHKHAEDILIGVAGNKIS